MAVQLLSAVLVFFMAAQATPDILTADGFHAWLAAGGALDSNAKLIHTQMEQQRASLPPWWPDDVYAQEEEAIQKVDFVDAALPFYQTCMTNREARILAKLSQTPAGQRVSSSALQTHSQAAEQGASPMTAQVAGEDAAHRTASSLTNGDRQNAAASLSPDERAYVEQNLTPDWLAAFRTCTHGALAKTADVMKAQQEKAVEAVVDANRAQLIAARTQWEKEHPAKTP
jgi:hypothetical protein